MSENFLILQQPKENLGFIGFLISKSRLFFGANLFISFLVFLTVEYWIGITIFIALLFVNWVYFKYLYKPTEKIINKKKINYKEQKRRFTGL